MIESVLEHDEATISNPDMNDDKIFIKLKDWLKKFTIEADEAIQKCMTSVIPAFKY